MRLLGAVAVAVLALGVAVQAEAVSISCTNPPSNIACTGTLTWNDATHQLTLTLNNTGTDGDLTAIALNFPGTFTGVTLTSAPTTNPPVQSGTWVLGLDGMQDFEFGAVDVNDGLDPGESGTFVWTFTGATTGLTSADFVAAANKTATCNTSNNGAQDAWGCVHYQRTSTPAGSEFVQLAAAGVPEPATLLLLGAGLAGLAVIARKKLR